MLPPGGLPLPGEEQVVAATAVDQVVPLRPECPEAASFEVSLDSHVCSYALWDLFPDDLDLLNASFGVFIRLESKELGGWLVVVGEQLDGPGARKGYLGQTDLIGTVLIGLGDRRGRLAIAVPEDDGYPLQGAAVGIKYLTEESDSSEHRFAFSYTITITNESEEAVKLLNRFWHIRDANDKVQEVSGEGVIGQQPRLEKGQSFKYTSGAIIETNAGTMEGYYEFITDDGDLFKAPIPAFTLADPATLH